jgi:hypothetical protein
MKKDREQIQQEALSRAASGIVLSNYPAIFEGFIAKGIAESEIKPRENVFTFQAWKALGRALRSQRRAWCQGLHVRTSRA